MKSENSMFYVKRSRNGFFQFIIMEELLRHTSLLEGLKEATVNCQASTVGWVAPLSTTINILTYIRGFCFDVGTYTVLETRQ